MFGNNDQDIHDRHAAQASSAASTAAGRDTMAETKSDKTKTTQEVRDAHFQEDGVKADGTLPKTDDAGDKGDE